MLQIVFIVLPNNNCNHRPTSKNHFPTFPSPLLLTMGLSEPSFFLFLKCMRNAPRFVWIVDEHLKTSGDITVAKILSFFDTDAIVLLVCVLPNAGFRENATTAYILFSTLYFIRVCLLPHLIPALLVKVWRGLH